jgi:hypothetical protein
MLSRLGVCHNFLRDGVCKRIDCKYRHHSDDKEEKKEEKTTTHTSSKPVKKDIEEIKEVMVKDGFVSTFDERSYKKGEGYKTKKEEERLKLLKMQKCRFLFEKGTCRYGDKCYYSHAGPKVAARPTTTASGAAVHSRISRPEAAMPVMAPVDLDWVGAFSKLAAMAPSRPKTSRPAPKKATAAVKETAEEKKKREDELDRYESNEEEDGVNVDEADDEIEVLDNRLRKIYLDLIRLEPVRKSLFRGKSLDIMFIIDCTGSMGSWIEASKKEIKSIIECIRNQYFGIQIRISIIAYRDHCDGKMISEIFSFSEDVEAAKKFISSL